MNRRAALSLGRGLASLTLIVLLWSALVEVFDVSSYVVPSPWEAVLAVSEKRSEIAPLVAGTLLETVLGFAVGAAIGFMLGVVLAQWDWVRSLLYPALIAGQAIPIVAIAAPLVILLGFGLLPKVVIVAWIVFFPVTVSVVDGLASIDKDLLNLAKVMGGRPLRVFLRVKLPATVVPLFTGLKIGATYAVTGAVIGELVASQGTSLAGYQRAANGFLNTPLVYGVTLVMTAIGVGWFLLVLGAERVATPWRTRSVARRRRWAKPGESGTT